MTRSTRRLITSVTAGAAGLAFVALLPATALAQTMATLNIGGNGNQQGPPTSGPHVPALLGVNGAPLRSSGGSVYDVAELYKAVSISSVRTHDDVFDPCKVYEDDRIALQQKVGGFSIITTTNNPSGAECTPAETPEDWVRWSSFSSPPTGTFDFSQVDIALAAIARAGAKVYLRIGESWNGSDRIANYSDYADVAATLASYVATNAPIDFAEVWNEPDGRFWDHPSDDGSTSGEDAASDAFYDLYSEIVTQATSPLGLVTGGAGFTSGGMEDLSARKIARHWSTDAHLDGDSFISGHFYDVCSTYSEQNLVNWIDTTFAKMDEEGIEVPLHVTEWNLTAPVSSAEEEVCADYGSSGHATYTAAGLILMSLPEFNIKRSHFYRGIGNGSFALFHPSATNVSVNPAAFGYWGFASIASKIRVNTTQNWGSGSGTAADAARAGIRWFGQAASNFMGNTFVLLVNDQATSMNLRVITSWHPTTAATIRQVAGLAPFTVPTTLSGTTRTVSATDAAAAFSVPSSTQSWTSVGTTSEMVVSLPAYSISIMSF